MRIQNQEKGQSLIEVLIALAASVAVVSAIAVTVITSLNNADFTKNQNLATGYSREGMDIVKQLAKSNWSSFLANYNSTNYCLAQGSTTLTLMTGVNCQKNIANLFDRRIIIEQNSISCQDNGNVKVTSWTLWSDSKCQTGDIFCHEVKLESCFANINTVNAP